MHGVFLRLAGARGIAGQRIDGADLHRIGGEAEPALQATTETVASASAAANRRPAAAVVVMAVFVSALIISLGHVGFAHVSFAHGQLPRWRRSIDRYCGGEVNRSALRESEAGRKYCKRHPIRSRAESCFQTWDRTRDWLGEALRARDTERVGGGGFYNVVWNKADEAEARRILDADFRFRASLGPELRGPGGFIVYMRTVRAALENFVCIIDEMIVAQDRVAARVSFRGTHRGSFFGAAPTGREIRWAGDGVLQDEGRENHRALGPRRHR